MFKQLPHSKIQPQKPSLLEPKSTRTPLQKNQNLQNFFGSTQPKKTSNPDDSSQRVKTSQKIKIKDLPQGSPRTQIKQQYSNGKPLQKSLQEVNITVYRNFDKYENTSQHSQPQSQHLRKSSISSNSTFLGGRSTNSVFSYRSTSAKKRFLTDKTISVQKIDMRKLISKKPDLYLDTAFTSTLDSLLEQSYQLVQTKKQQLFDLANVECDLQKEIDQLIQEIAPLQSQVQSQEEALFHSNQTLVKYQNETRDYQQQIRDNQELRKQTEETIENETQKLLLEIASLEQTAAQIQTDINVSKAQHDLTRTKLEQNCSNLTQNLGVLHEMLQHTKNIAFEKQVELNEKTRKMENKSKMFIGMLRHY